MATREFDSSYIHLLCEAALVGLDNHVHNEWAKECRRQHAWQTKEMERKNKSWLRKIFRCKPVTLSSLKDFIEERKQWLYSEYSQTYTFWNDHSERWIGVESTLKRIKRLSADNNAGNVVTVMDDSEFNTVSKYAKVVRE
jgi:hypothetical protein